MTKSDEQVEQRPKRLGAGRKVFVAIALVTAVLGFVTGMASGPSVAFWKGAPSDAVTKVHAGTFPLAMPGVEMQFVDASVSIRPTGAPDGASNLRDAVHVLLTEASGFPLVLDGRTTLTELEEVIMSMAPVSAPWLVELELVPTTDKPAPTPDQPSHGT